MEEDPDQEERRCSGKVVTGIMEGQVRLPHNPRWGDLATTPYEAVKFEDSDLVVGRVDSLVQHFPSSRGSRSSREKHGRHFMVTSQCICRWTMNDSYVQNVSLGDSKAQHLQ